MNVIRTQAPRIILVILILGIVLLFRWIVLSPPAEDGLAPAVTVPFPAAAYTPPENTYFVGSQACVECHAEIADTYFQHPMYLTARRVGEDPFTASIERTHITVPKARQQYTIEQQGGLLVHREFMSGDVATGDEVPGQKIYEQEFVQEYVIGSGQRARAYLHRRNDMLFMSPLNWYRDGNRWALAPGYQPEDPRRFERRVTEECLSCHTGQVAVVERHANRFQDPALIEASIGCERCHGPGGQHIAFHQGLASGLATDPIINPQRLETTAREAVCNQCHLQGAARILRPGRSDFDFRPGMNLTDIWTILDTDAGVTEDGRTRSVSHVQQMQASQCYIGSGGELGCITCHDPHGVPPAEEVSVYYRDRCLQCHTDESCVAPAAHRLTENDSCIACHMPKRDASNVAHISQTDHRIIRQRAATVQGDVAIAPEELQLFGDVEQLSDWEQRRGRSLGEFVYRSKKGFPVPHRLVMQLEQLFAEHPQDGDLASVLGAIATDAGKLELGCEYFTQALQTESAREAALTGLMKGNYLLSRPQAALEFSDRLLELGLEDATVLSLRADLLATLGQTAAGIEAAEAALRFNPTLIPVREWLIQRYTEQNNEAQRTHQAEILRQLRTVQPAE